MHRSELVEKLVTRSRELGALEYQKEQAVATVPVKALSAALVKAPAARAAEAVGPVADTVWVASAKAVSKGPKVNSEGPKMSKNA